MNVANLREPFYYQAGRTGCVLIHGFTGTPFALHGLGKALHSQGMTVYGPCLPGHCTTPKELIGISYHEWIETGRNAVLKLKNDCDAIFLVGLSMGGTIALYLASELSVHGCVSIAAPIDSSCFQRPGYSIVQRFVRYWPKWRLWMKPYHPELGYRWYPLPAVHMFFKLLQETRQRLSQVKCPLLAIHSASDPRVPISHMTRIINSVSSEYKESMILKNHKHTVTLGRDKWDVFKKIGCFIKDQEGLAK